MFDDPIGPGGFIKPFAQAAPTPSDRATPVEKEAHVCVPPDIVDHHAWENPRSGGKMEAFKKAATDAIRREARYANIDDNTQFIVQDRFGNFDPATTDSRNLVVAMEASTCPVDDYSYKLKVQVNR